MLELLSMWALLEIVGVICLPLTVTLFKNLPDRGWAFTKGVGITVLAFCVWLPLMTLRFLPFSQGFIAGVLLLILAGNAIGLAHTWKSIVQVIRTHLGYVIACELIFLGMVFLLGWIRSYTPNIQSFEMYMDEGILAAIMRSPHFPPNDPWLSGYPINYYYYAHYTIALRAKLLGQSPSIAFNTGISTAFGLTALNIFGVTCNIVAWASQRRRTGDDDWMEHPGPGCFRRKPASQSTSLPVLTRAIPFGVLSLLMGVVLGNLASTQQWWEQRGNLPAFYWFNVSRVVAKTINEFPAFSFLLSDFHAHVLTLAFTILAVAAIFNLFLERGSGEDAAAQGLRVFGRGWRLPLHLGFLAMVLGGLFTMNGWDLPTYLGLAVLCLALQQWLAYQRVCPELVLDVFTAGTSLIALSFFLYAPFYLQFISPSQGIGIVDGANRSPLPDEMLIYGTFLFVFVSLLLASFFQPRPTAPRAEAVAPGTAALSPETPSPPAREGRKRHIARPAWLTSQRISLALTAVAALLMLAFIKNSLWLVVTFVVTALGVQHTLIHLPDRPRAFTLLLGTVAFALVAMTELVYLRDVFASSFPRMNTVFKFYFQAWALLSIACGAGLYFLLERFQTAQELSGFHRWVCRCGQRTWAAVCLLLLLAGLVYPIVGTSQRTNGFQQRTTSLDGLDYMQFYSPGDYEAIRWLNSHIQGDPVIVEAFGPQGGDYSEYGRISAFTGLPTVMGWAGHEYQWRVNWLDESDHAADFDRRGADIHTIYTSPDPQTVLALLARYQVTYLYVGNLEEATYAGSDLGRFRRFLPVVYCVDGVTVYQVPGSG